MKKILSALILMMGLIGVAQATPVVWTIPSTTLSNGSVVSGTFTYDTATSTMTAVNIANTASTSGVAYPASTYTFVGSRQGPFVYAQSVASTVGGATSFAFMPLNIPSALGPYTLPAIYLGYCSNGVSGLCDNLNPVGNARDVVLSNIAPTTAPIPTLSEWAMIFLSSLMAMFAIYRTRRQ